MKQSAPRAQSQAIYKTGRIESAAPGCSLAIVAVGVPDADAVQLDPQANPLGQHPPPSDAAQLNQPVAHEPSNATDAAFPVGTTIVMPSDVTIVVEAVVGQEVVSQFRPTRQQPPWYTAEQA